MRGHKSRLVAAVVLAGLCASVVGWSDRFVRGQPIAAPALPAPGKAKDKDKKDDNRPARDQDIPFGFPYERDAKQQLQAARDYLKRNDVPWNTVCSVLQFILDARSDSFFDVEYKAGDTIQINRISVKTEANRIIAAFPKAGLEFYQQNYGQAAVLMLETAVGNNYDLATLSEVSQRYFHTRAGAEGTVLLASIYLERGNYLEAAYAFERVLSRVDAEEFLTPNVLFKAALALKRSGDPRHAMLFKDVSTRLTKETSRNGLVIRRTKYTAEQVQAELDRPVSAVKTVSTVGEWAMRYGNPARNATVEGGPPFLVPAFKPTAMIETRRDEDKTANAWLTDELDRLFDRENRNNRSLPMPGFFPVTTPDLVIFRSYDGVYAVATRDHVHRGELVRAGSTRWISKTHVGVHQMMTPANPSYYDPRSREEALSWWNTYKGNGSVASVLFENPLIGTLAHDGQNVYYADDLAIPPPPPMRFNDFGMPGVQTRHSGDLADANRAGELVAVDIATGNRVWTLGRVESKSIKGPILPRLTEEDADKATSAFHLCVDAVFLGPPLPLNGRLYVLIEQGGVVRLVCLDPRNLVQVKDWPQQVPTLVWSQKLGRPVNTLPDDSVRRYQGAFLAAGEGIIVCPTNSGAIVAVDIMSRSLLWAHAYRRTDQTAAVRPSFNPNTGQPIMPSLLPTDRWRAAAPIISGGRLVVTAYDSNKLECLDLRNGKLLWTTPRESTDLYVGGVVNDKVLIVGRTSVRAYDLRGEKVDSVEPKLAWTTPITVTPTGHGVAGKGVFYLPVRQDTAGKDNVPAAEIWAFNVETGEIPSKTSARKRTGTGPDGPGTDLARYGLGNLVFQDGLVVAQSAVEVACYPQLELKEAEMNRKLAANPKDPDGLSARGEIFLDKGQLKDAIADFKEAERNNPPEPIRLNLREKLYVAYTELVRTEVQKNNFAAVEPILREYEALCEVSLDGATDPFEKKRREDETLRRKRLQLYLLARGRESQGRLGEAFDQYLALASLGEAKTLFEMPDEPGVRMRPDVWARGRIERMISKTPDPAARKSLEDRVLAEWKKIEGGNDLPRLREFVSVFGPYFPVGATAELQLSEKLLETNNDDDARDAQTHLSALRASATDPVVRARATEALARLMTRTGLLEDAVGLYLQLGKEYPKVVVRDGKTGEDYLTELLTDRRLLPYIEPSRFPLPSRVKAEQVRGNPGGQMGTIFEVEPEGDLFPMYRRLRFVIDLNAAGNGMWTLRAIDRATGADRCRFGNLQQPQINYNPAQWLSAKFVQASGHLLLVQLGPMVYCLDLAEKKELWQKNLLGDGPANPNGNANMSQEITPDGDVLIRYDEGYSVTLGKSATIQPGYVCLATRDGLEVIEPVSRKPLWTRRNVSGRLQVYGDARHILLVEMSETRPYKPVKTTLLRAVDGIPVDGAPDSGRTLADARGYRILGRNALITQGAADQPKVVRLYDFATGKDVWRHEADAKAVPVRSFTHEWAGFIKPTGEVEVFATRDGKPAGTFKIDPAKVEAHLSGCGEAQLFADPERFYLVLDRDANARNVPIFYGYTLRTQRVNGPMYCFDRATGARRWFFEDVLENQMLIVEQFADLPVIIAANPIRVNNTFPYRVVVIEKDRGRLLFNNSVGQGGNFFQNMMIDPKNGTIDLNRFDVRLHISPDDGKPSGGK